jgi:hypothetical protein
MGKVAKKVVPKKRAAAPSKVYRVCLARYVSTHSSQAEASAALKKVKLQGDDIAFIVEQK